MQIVDAQVHVWRPESAESPWLSDGHTYAHRDSYTGPELLADMNDVGVARAILVTPGWQGDSNEYSLQVANENPSRFAVMGRLPLERRQSRTELAQWWATPGLLGARLTFTRGPARAWLEDGTAAWFWPLAEQLDIPVALYAPRALRKIGEIAAAHPRLRIMVDHAGLPIDLRTDELGELIAEVSVLARFPNVAVKATSIPSYATDDYPFASMHDAINRLADAYGPQRVFWGSDLTRLKCSYDEALRLFTEALPFLSPEERALMTGDGVCAWLRWA